MSSKARDGLAFLADGGEMGERTYIVPDFRPDVLEGMAERMGMLGPQHLRISVVVEKAQVRPPRDEHREL